MTTVLITGATRGLGLATARAAAARGAHVLVAGPNPARAERAAAAVGGEPVTLDLGSLAAVRRVAGTLPAVDAVACNAGVSLPGALEHTEDGYERTFQVNVLGHAALLDALAPRRVVFVGSATHDPAQWTGMPDPPAGGVAAMARGETQIGGRGAGPSRYAGSKLLCTTLTLALARARPDVHVSAVDPGLMPSTGLARDYPAAARRLMGVLTPLIARLPFASTPERSGAVLASLLVDADVPSGTVLDHRGRPARLSERARDQAFQDEVLNELSRLVGGSSFLVSAAHRPDLSPAERVGALPLSGNAEAPHTRP
jgi:NAD(P)-dependent dehydrogenase (short-subunit alcohol dehydrogenase family)